MLLKNPIAKNLRKNNLNNILTIIEIYININNMSNTTKNQYTWSVKANDGQLVVAPKAYPTLRGAKIASKRFANKTGGSVVSVSAK